MKFEAFLAGDGKYAWRIRDENGEVVRFKPGWIHLPPDPEADERSRAAVQTVLEKLAKTADRADGA